MKQADADRATIEDSQRLAHDTGARAQQQILSLETALKSSEAARKIAEESIIAGEQSSASTLASMQAETFLEKQVRCSRVSFELDSNS